MKKEVSVSIIAVVIVAVAILSVSYLNLRPTGFAVLDQYINESECVAAEYTWEKNITGQDCTIETLPFDEIGFIDSPGYTLTGSENSTNFTILEAFNVTGSAHISIDSDEYSVDSSTGVVTNETNVTYPDVNFTYMYENETCVDVVTGGQCIGDVCDSNNLNLCLDENNCTVALGYWYNDACNAGVEPSCSNDLELCLDETSCTDDASGYWYNDACNGNECETDSQCGSNSDCRGGFCKKIVVNEEQDQTQEPIISVEEPQKITKISLGTVDSQDIIQENSKDLSLSFQNTGTEPVSSCALSGDDSGWITITGSPTNVVAEATGSLGFLVSIPKETPVGAYTLSLSITCAETSGSTSFAVNVLQKKIDFNITNVQRTRQNRVSVDYIIIELAGEDQDLEIFFAITDTSGVQIANASQNRSIDANKTDDFRTNIAINESLLPVNETTGEPIETNLTLSVNFNSQVYSSSVLESITLGAITGAAIFGGLGAGSLVIVVVVVLILATVFFVARRMRKSKAA